MLEQKIAGELLSAFYLQSIYHHNNCCELPEHITTRRKKKQDMKKEIIRIVDLRVNTRGVWREKREIFIFFI